MGRYIYRLNALRNPGIAGAKSYNLHLLERWGFNVPKTYICPIQAFRDYSSGNTRLIDKICQELQSFFDGAKRYAVRSSTNIEDGSQYSFAGQFNTYLNINSLDGLSEAIENIWKTRDNEQVQYYLERVQSANSTLEHGVIIQEMVESKMAGVVFTRNPVTGFDEIIVEMVEGQGASLVQKGITPVRYVYKWGNWLEAPAKEGATFKIINTIVNEASKIEKKYGKPVDLEWAYDGREIYWLQLRKITGLSNINIYSNRMSREMLPGMIKPLVWTVNIPVVNSSWKRIFVELIGKNAEKIDIHLLSKAFYYRAYFNMGVIGNIFELLGMPRESLEMVMGVQSGSSLPKFKMRPGLKALKYLPKLMVFVIGKIRFQKQAEVFFNRQKSILENIYSNNLEKMRDIDLFKSTQELMRLNQETSYYTILSQLFAGMYNRLFRQYLKRNNIDSSNIVVSPDPQKTSSTNLNQALEKLKQYWEDLPTQEKEEIQHRDLECWIRENKLYDFKSGILKFFQTFGHYSESILDLSQKTFRENPDLVLNMIKEYRTPERFNESQWLDNLNKLPILIWKKMILNHLYKLAVRACTNREKITYLYNFGYGLFRPRFQRLARIFLEKGYILQEDDIFYLRLEQIEEIINHVTATSEYSSLCQKIKSEMSACSTVVLPEVIIGDSIPPIIQVKRSSDMIKGVPVSNGFAEGTLRVIRTQEDFPKMKDNDILLIPYSDISWTPLFTRAKAIVSEAGGFLSHCAITAREFGIPAVVAINHAGELSDGDIVSVNGFTGEITRVKSNQLDEN